MGGGPHAEAGYYGIETGGAQVGRGPFAGAGAMNGLGLDALGWDDGYGREDQGQEGG